MAPSIEITVRGSYTAYQPPERGTVHSIIAYEGPAMEPVYDRVARDLEAVKESIGPLHSPDHGPVTWWSAQQLRTWHVRSIIEEVICSGHSIAVCLKQRTVPVI